MNAIVPAGNNALTPTSMDSAIKLAEMMALGRLVPKHLQDSPGDCLMVIEAAIRWQMSPFAVAQCTSVIQGKLMFEGKLVAAALNASGVLSSRLMYEFVGDGAARAVKVSATLRGESHTREIELALKDATTSNSMWTKQPDQQLVYAGTRVWARRYAPEVMLGVYAPEEFEQAAPFDGTTIEVEAPKLPTTTAMTSGDIDRQNARAKFNAEVPLKPTAPTNGKVRHSRAPPPGAPDADWRACLDWIAPAMAKLRTRDAVVEVANGPTCSDIVANGPQWAQAELSKLLAENYARFTDAVHDDPEHDEELPPIVGEERVGAG